MRNLSLLIVLILISELIRAQNPKGFEAMCATYISGTVQTIDPFALKELIAQDPNLILLDARELSEYEISHIEGAKYIGYDNFRLNALPIIPKETKIYVYCSIGFRSEKIGEQLMHAGYTNVHHLYGGIFAWANNGYPLVSAKNKATTAVHSYNKEWAKWINTAHLKVIIQ